MILSLQAENDALKNSLAERDATLEQIKKQMNDVTNELNAKKVQLTEVLGRGTPDLEGLVQTLYNQIDRLQKNLEKKDAIIEDKETELKKANEAIKNIALARSGSRSRTETTVGKGKRKKPDDGGSKA